MLRKKMCLIEGRFWIVTAEEWEKSSYEYAKSTTGLALHGEVPVAAKLKPKRLAIRLGGHGIVAVSGYVVIWVRVTS